MSRRLGWFLLWGMIARALAGHGDGITSYDYGNMVKRRLRNADGSFDAWVDPSTISNDGRPVRYFLRDSSGRMTGTGRAFQDGGGAPAGAPAHVDRPAVAREDAPAPAAARAEPAPARPIPAPAAERARARPEAHAPENIPQQAKPRGEIRRPGDPPPRSERIHLDGDRPPRVREEPRPQTAAAVPATEPPPDRSHDLEQLDPAKPRYQKLKGGGKVLEDGFVPVYAQKRGADGSPVFDQDHTYLIRKSDFDRENDAKGTGFGTHGSVPIFQRVFNEGTQTWDRVQQVTTGRPTGKAADGQGAVYMDRGPIATTNVNEPEPKAKPEVATTTGETKKAEPHAGGREVKLVPTGSDDVESAKMERRLIGLQTGRSRDDVNEQQILDTGTLLVYSRADYEAEARKGKLYHNLRPIGRLPYRDSPTYNPY